MRSRIVNDEDMRVLNFEREEVALCIVGKTEDGYDCLEIIFVSGRNLVALGTDFREGGIIVGEELPTGQFLKKEV